MTPKEKPIKPLLFDPCECGPESLGYPRSCCLGRLAVNNLGQPSQKIKPEENEVE